MFVPAPRATDALLAIDLQNDFMPGGALAVARGDEVPPIVNRLAQAFDHVVLTQDWHPAGHISFAASHPGRQPFENITLPYGAQTLWPVHCVQGSPGAALHAGLAPTLHRARAIVRKGQRPALDSYSAFVEADRKTPTGLAGYLRELGVTRVFCCGLATDYCVAWSALDARAAGFEVALIDDACRAIDLNGSLAAAWRQLQAAGGSGLTRRRRQRCGLALTTLCYHDLFPPRKDTGMRNTMKLTAAIACGLALSACGGGGSDDNNALPAPSSSIAACFTASSNVNYSMTPTTSSTIDPMMSSMKVSSGPGTFNGQTASLVQISERVYIQDGGWNESAYAVKSDGVYSLGHRRGGYDALPGSPKEVFCTTSPSTPIPLNLQPGQFFDNKAGSETCSNGTSSMTYPTRTTLVRFETITLAGKTFSNACHFQEQELTDEGRVDLSSSPVEMWFAPGYGLIKMIDEDGYTMQYSDRDQLASPLTPP